MSVKRSSTQSETPSRFSRRSSAAGTASVLKQRPISNASLISNVSNATTVTPQNPNGSETYSSWSPASVRAKRMSTSIPTLTSIRRQSAPVHRLISDPRPTPLVSSPLISAPPRVIPSSQCNLTASKASPSVAGSARTSRISVSTPPSQADFARFNSDEDFTGAMSIWDGDDMTMDMLTEANDQDVDEEVSIYINTFIA